MPNIVKYIVIGYFILGNVVAPVALMLWIALSERDFSWATFEQLYEEISTLPVRGLSWVFRLAGLSAEAANFSAILVSTVFFGGIMLLAIIYWREFRDIGREFYANVKRVLTSFLGKTP